MDAHLPRLRDSLAAARRVVALTGAGISAESGVPTFRGAEGLWRTHRAADLATPEAFARDPALVWEFYNWRRGLISRVAPNPGHAALAELERRVPDFTLITQNIDGLHRQAGSGHVLEMHGNLWEVRCTRCHGLTTDRRVDLGTDPRCPSCGGLLRPHVVWFGESLDPAVLSQCFSAVRACDVMLVVGTSAVVYPAAALPAEARAAGAVVAEINLEPTPLSSVADICLFGKSGEILPRLLASWREDLSARSPRP